MKKLELNQRENLKSRLDQINNGVLAVTIAGETALGLFTGGVGWVFARANFLIRLRSCLHLTKN